MTYIETEETRRQLVGYCEGRGYNQTTASGKPFFVLDARPDEIHIDDIAEQLGRQTRWNGALRKDVEIFTTAQHSVIVEELVAADPSVRRLPKKENRIIRLKALLHDSEEAYTGDMIRPLKPDNPAFVAHATRLRETIFVRFGLSPTEPPIIKIYDDICAWMERRDILAPQQGVMWVSKLKQPSELPDRIIKPVGIFASMQMFKDRFNELYNMEIAEDE